MITHLATVARLSRPQVHSIRIYTYSSKYLYVFSTLRFGWVDFFFILCSAALEKGGDRSRVNDTRKELPPGNSFLIMGSVAFFLLWSSSRSRPGAGGGWGLPRSVSV